MKHKCLATTSSKGEWILHYMLGHLNFRDIIHLKKRNMVSGLPGIRVPNEVCKECVQAKQHKNSFSKDAGSNSNATIEVIYSYVCGYIQVDSIGGNNFFFTFIDDYSKN